MDGFNDNDFLKKILRIIKGTVIAIIITMILLCVSAILLTYTSLPEMFINPIIILTTVISVLVGSIISTLKINKNGLINGFFVGLIYIGIIYFISSIITMNFSFNLYSFIMILFTILAGIIGGIIGVNLKN